MSAAVRARWEDHLLALHTGPDLSDEIEAWADRHGHDLAVADADEIAELYLEWCEDTDQARADSAAEARWEEDHYAQRWG